MRSNIIAFVSVALSVFALNGCAAPEDIEEEGGTESNLHSARDGRTRTPATGVGNSAGNGGILKNPTPKPAPKPAPAPAPADPAPMDNDGDASGTLPVLVTWNGVEGTEASLDVVMNDGRIIGPCIAVDILRDEFNRGVSDGLGYLFNGNCISANENPNPMDIRTFRICSARNNDWANATCTESAPWNHTQAPVHIDNH